jgi:hypothetical protein
MWLTKCLDDNTTSSTYGYNESLVGKFNIGYVDGSGSHGDLITETLGIGGIELTDFTVCLLRSLDSQPAHNNSSFEIPLIILTAMIQKQRLTMKRGRLDGHTIQLCRQGF